MTYCYVLSDKIVTIPSNAFAISSRTFKRQTNLAESGHDIYDEEWSPTKEENPHDDPYCNGSLVLLQQRLLKPLATADKIDLLERWGVKCGAKRSFILAAKWLL